MILSLTTIRRLAAAITGAMLLSACGGEESAAGAAVDGDRPTVVVSTSILGDVVKNLVGDDVYVVVLMPVGADPHEFQASAQQVAELAAADSVITNGGGFEEGLLDVLEAAENDGVPVFEAMDAVEPIEFDEKGHDDHGDEEHDDDDEHGDDEHDDHGHEGVDPHFFTDPGRMSAVVGEIATFLSANVDGIDTAALESNVEGYADELDALDDDVLAMLDAVPSERRVLVTNHDVFGYFADRYGFEIAGTVIPSGTTAASANAQAMVELAEVIEHEGVPAIFADTSSSDELAATLASDIGGIEVVELFSESLGDADSDGATYIDMVRTNATRIADALAG